MIRPFKCWTVRQGHTDLVSISFIEGKQVSYCYNDISGVLSSWPPDLFRLV